MSKPYCKIAFDHQPGETCAECGHEVDEFGNTEADFRNCCFPNCGCDGARLCMAPNGANEFSCHSNVEGMWLGTDGKSAKARESFVKTLGTVAMFNHITQGKEPPK